MMKKLSLMMVVLGLFLLAGCQDKSSQNTSNQNIIFTTLNNKNIDLASLKGKWVIINYWASWCKPCYKEIPALNSFSKNNSTNVVVLGVSYDQVEPDQLPNIVKQMNIQFTTLKYDPSQALGIEHIPGLPATFIINPKGQLVKTLLGEQTEQSLQKQIA